MASKTGKRTDLPEVVRLKDDEYGMLRSASALTLPDVRFIWGYNLNGLGTGQRGWTFFWIHSGRSHWHTVLPCDRFNPKDFDKVNERVTKVLIPIVTDLLNQVSQPL